MELNELIFVKPSIGVCGLNIFTCGSHGLPKLGHEIEFPFSVFLNSANNIFIIPAAHIISILPAAQAQIMVAFDATVYSSSQSL